MNTIIMIFSLPIGIYLLLKEKKQRSSYEAVFYDFYKEVKKQDDLNKDEKTTLLVNMLEQNAYKVEKYDDKIVGTKKIFSIPWMMVGIGFVYIGLLIYLIYYFYFQKPHRVEFSLKNL